MWSRTEMSHFLDQQLCMFGYTGAQVGLMLNYNAVVLFSSHEILVSINNFSYRKLYYLADGFN